MSTITVAELYVGARNNKEIEALDLLTNSFTITDVDKLIAIKGGEYKRFYGRSHGVGLADAIIAACADNIGAYLVTLNVKHYPMYDKTLIPYNKN